MDTKELYPERESLKAILIDYIKGEGAYNTELWNSVMISGAWGDGKTFLIDEVIKEVSVELEDVSKSIKKFDAWDYDMHVNFMQAIIHWAIDNGLVSWHELGKIKPSLSFPIINLEVEKREGQIGESVSTKAIFDKIVLDILPERIDTLIIDDLDRCRPEFAIDIINTIRHLQKRIKIIVLVDEQQLAAVIKSYYGNEYDAYKYLEKIFQERYILANPNYSYILAREVFYQLEYIPESAWIHFAHYINKSCTKIGSLNSRLILQISDFIQKNNCDFNGIIYGAGENNNPLIESVLSCRISLYILMLKFINRENYLLLRNYINGYYSDKMELLVKDMLDVIFNRALIYEESELNEIWLDHFLKYEKVLSTHLLGALRYCYVNDEILVVYINSFDNIEVNLKIKLF